MTRWATLAIGFLAFCSFPVAGPAQAQSGSGWITLFDGKNLDHWQGDGNANFAIDDGSIVAKDKKDAKTTAFLISKEKYKDFQIYAEFWVSNDANSGIFIRCEDPKKPGAKTCYECNIFDTRPDPSYGTGAIVYHAEVNPMPKAGGKWSTMEITAKGRDLSILFDGKQTASVRSGMHTEGPLALQFGEGEVKCRKVAVKPLPPDPFRHQDSAIAHQTARQKRSPSRATGAEGCLSEGWDRKHSHVNAEVCCRQQGDSENDLL